MGNYVEQKDVQNALANLYNELFTYYVNQYSSGAAAVPVPGSPGILGAFNLAFNGGVNGTDPNLSAASLGMEAAMAAVAASQDLGAVVTEGGSVAQQALANQEPANKRAKIEDGTPRVIASRSSAGSLKLRSHRRTCSVEGCMKYARTGGVCVAHGANVRRKVCVVDGCLKFARRGGVCIGHGAKNIQSTRKRPYVPKESQQATEVTQLARNAVKVAVEAAVASEALGAMGKRRREELGGLSSPDAVADADDKSADLSDDSETSSETNSDDSDEN